MLPCRVFICDDAPSYRHLLRAVLEPEGIDVVGEAGNGQECLNRVGDARPDVVLLDINMPVMDGISTLPHLRAQAPDTAVVLLTSASPTEVPEPAREQASAFLRKPLGV